MTTHANDATIEWQVGIQWMATPTLPGYVEGHPVYSYTSGNHKTLDEAKADLEGQLRAAKGIGLGDEGGDANV